MREVGAKVAAALLPYLPEGQQNVTGIVEVSEAVVAYFVYGPSRFGVGAFNAPAEPEPPAAPPAPPEQPQAEQPPHPAEQPSGPPIRINENVAPCDQCGAIQGEAHSTDCIPF